MANIPGRDLLLLLTFCVIFGTLVIQGLTLSPVVRWLRVVDDSRYRKEERLARLKANEAALARLETVGALNRARPGVIETSSFGYMDRIRQLRNEAPHGESASPLFSADFEELAREACKANATLSSNCAMKRPSATRPSAEFNVILTSPKPASNGQRHEILTSPIGWQRARVRVSFPRP